MSGLMMHTLWCISCLGVLFCCISFLQEHRTVVVAGFQASFPDVVQYYNARRFLQESSPPPSSSFLSPTSSPTPSPSLIPTPSPFPTPATPPTSAPPVNPPQSAPSLLVSIPPLSPQSAEFASPPPSTPPLSPSFPPLSPSSSLSANPPASSSPLSPSPQSAPAPSLSPVATPLSPPTSLSPNSAAPSSSSPPLSSPLLSPPSPPPSPSPSTTLSPPFAPPPSSISPASSSPPSSPPIAPPPSLLSPANPPSPPPATNSPPPSPAPVPPPTSPTSSPPSASSAPSPAPPPSNNVVPSPSPTTTPAPSLSSPPPSVVPPSSAPFFPTPSPSPSTPPPPPPPPPPNAPPPVLPPSPTPAPVSSSPPSPAPSSTSPAPAPSNFLSLPPPPSPPIATPSPSPGCSCSGTTSPRAGLSNTSSSSCDCVNVITVQLQFANALSNATSSQFQHELAQGLNFTNVQQVQVTSFNGSTGTIKLQVVSPSTLTVTAALVPLTGSSFAQNSSHAIRTAISDHDVVFNSEFGNYTVLNLIPSLGGVPTPAPSLAALSSSKNSSTALIIKVAVGGAGILIILALIFCICCWSRRGDDPESVNRGPTNTRVTAVLDPEVMTPNEQIIPADSKSFPRPENTQQFSYEELREATNDFAPECFLGEGGFGKVYRGVLRDGTEVAIKKLTIGGHQGDREFLVEVEMLSRLHHRHLVKLLGYFCSHEPRQQLLCYELIPNGSLEAWLHGSLGVMRGPLDWATRMKIAIGAARGLAYLHEDSQPCVIHRDFKASNILLQNNFNPKVADFGLARLAPEGQANYVSTRVMGTFGYVAPEYAMTGHLLVKSDVYSYGVVLLELLSGRKPVDLSQSEGGENITTWATPMLNNTERVFELADVRLEGKYPREDFVKVAALAATCIAREWRMRPTMGEVVQTLTTVCRSLEYDLSSDGDRGVNSAGEREGGASTPTSSTSGGSHLGFSSQWHPTTHTSANLGSEDGFSSLFSSGTPPEPLSDNLSRTHIIPEDLHEGR